MSEMLGYEGRQLTLNLGQPFEADKIRPDYAVIDIKQGFDWNKIMDKARDLRDIQDGQPLYLVVFRSQFKEGLSKELRTELEEADIAALEEAKAAKDGEFSGLLCYFPGTEDNYGNCMSFCLWTDRQAALDRMGPAHGKAASYAAQVYDEFEFERYIISRQQPSAQVSFDVFQPLAA